MLRNPGRAESECCARAPFGALRYRCRNIDEAWLLAPTQRVFDLAIDALKFVGVIADLRAQAPLAKIDDLPQLAALPVTEAAVGKPDSGLHDFAPPSPGARVDRVDFPVWHVRSFPPCRIWRDNGMARFWFPAALRRG
jgi:hypothetical protein